MLNHILIWYGLVPTILVIGVLVGLHFLPSNRYGQAEQMQGSSYGAKAARWLDAHVRSAIAWIRELMDPWDRHGNQQTTRPAVRPATPTSPAPAPARRIDTPALAAVPAGQSHPSEIAAIQGAVLAPPWQQLVAFVAAFEPETDGDHLAFLRGNAAGFLALAEAFMSYADTCLNHVGMDQAAVHSMIELAEVVGENAHDVNLVIRKFLVVYGKILEMLADGVQLPHNAREWLTGNEGAA